MAKESAATGNRKPARRAPAQSRTTQPTRSRSGPRPVEAGDTLARPGRRAAEADRVARGTSTALTVQEMAISDLLAKKNGAPASETLRQLQALISGASPDEVKALRRTLFKRDDPARPAVDPDT